MPPFTPQGDGNNNVAQNVPGSGNVPVTSTGGTSTYFGAGGTVTALAIKASEGRLFAVTVTTLGTAAATFYDNASAASGNVLGVVPASAPVGSIYQFQIPFVNGLYYAAGANQPAFALTYT